MRGLYVYVIGIILGGYVRLGNIIFLIPEAQHAHCVTPIIEPLSALGHQCAITNDVNRVKDADLMVITTDWTINGMPDELLSKCVWIDHGLAAFIKTNIPFDRQTVLKRNLFSSYLAFKSAKDNISATFPPWRSGSAKWNDGNCVIVGYPKNDYLFKYMGEKGKEWSMPKEPLILYAPTASTYNVLGGVPGNAVITASAVVHTLKEYGKVVVKMHEIGFPTHFDGVQTLDPHSNISLVLPHIDLLVTDLSSVAFEFAILNRPIIQISDKIAEKYYTSVGARTEVHDLRAVVERYLKNPELHTEDRQYWTEQTNFILDDKAAERAAQAIHECTL